MTTQISCDIKVGKVIEEGPNIPQEFETLLNSDYTGCRAFYTDSSVTSDPPGVGAAIFSINNTLSIPMSKRLSAYTAEHSAICTTI